MEPLKKPVFLAVWAAWAVFCCTLIGGHLGSWHTVLSLMTRHASVQSFAIHPILPFGLPLAVAHHALLLAAGAVIALGFANAGLSASRLIILPGVTGSERAAIGVLLGFTMIGTWYYGLALAGLFYPVLLFASIGGTLALPGIRRLFRGLTPFARVDAKLGWLVFASAPGLVALLAALLPDTNGDAFLYHLAIPEQMLKAHRFSSENICLTHQYPLTAEYAYSLAVSLGRDALAHLIQLAPFIAAVTLAAAWSVRQSGKAAGWITAGAVASFGLAGQMMIVAKNDLAAAAYPIAGAVCVARGLFPPSRAWLGLGMLLLGSGAAVKFNDFVFLGLGGVGIAATAVMARRPLLLGFRYWACGLALLPFLPWLVKTWLMTGDPVWPLLSSRLPGALWDAESGDLMEQLRRRWTEGNGPLHFPVVFIRALAGHQPAIACALPLLAAGALRAGAEFNWMLGFLAAGFVALWIASPVPDMRYALPLFVLLSASLAAGVVRRGAAWGPWTRRGALLAGTAGGLLPLGSLLTGCLEPHVSLAYLAGAISREEYLSERLTTYWQARSALAAIPGLDRLAGMQWTRSYLLPGRFMNETGIDTPWSWKFSRDSTTAREVARKFRQLGCRYILYNFMADCAPDPVKDPFRWNNRMLATWKDFVGRHLELAAVTETVDLKNGGFCLYRVRRVPLRRPPAYLPYLPGIRSLYRNVTSHALSGDMTGWLASARLLRKRLPDVDFAGDLVAKGYEATGKWREALECYRPGAAHGTLGGDNYFGMARCAVMLERWEEARFCIGMVKKHYPLTRTEARDQQGRIVDLGSLIDSMIAAKKTGAPSPAYFDRGPAR